MGALGCRGTEGSKNKRKRGLDDREGHVLGRMAKAPKNRKWAGMLGGDQRGSWGGMKWKQGAGRAYLTQMSNGKAKKQTTVQKKKQNNGLNRMPSS